MAADPVAARGDSFDAGPGGQITHMHTPDAARSHRSGLEVMGDTQHPEPNWHARAEEHRQMARAAIRVALKHGIHEDEILAEFGRVQIDEARGV